MAGNVVKRHLICFDFQNTQKTFPRTDVFFTLSGLFVWLGFRLLFVRLAVHFFCSFLSLCFVAKLCVFERT